MWWFKWRPRTRGRSKSQQIITTWQHAVIKIQGFMHFPSSPPEQRPLGDCTKLSFKRTVLTKWWARTCFLSWRAGKKLGWLKSRRVHLDTLNPRLLFSLVLNSIFRDQPIAWAAPGRGELGVRWVNKGYLQSFRPQNLSFFFFFPLPLHHLTQSSV